MTNIKILKKKFKCTIGLSDHSNDNIVANLALSLGAEVFEKHIALGNVKSLDSNFSLSGKEIFNYRNSIDNAFKLLQKKKSYFVSKGELKNRKFRRSIFAVKKIKKGDVFTINNIRIIRPSNGLEPKYYEKILGKKSKNNIKKGFPILKSSI